MSRRRGSQGVCSSCGQLGHNGTATGCSPTYLAAKLVLEGKATLSQAAERHGVSRQAVSERLVQRHGYRSPRSSVYR